MTKVTLVTSAKPLHERCSKCKRPNGTTFRFCERCREIQRKHNRKIRDATPVCPPGQRYCTGCGHIKPEDQFKSRHPRRQTLTKKCETCRQSLARTQNKPNDYHGQVQGAMGRVESEESMCCLWRDRSTANRSRPSPCDKVHRCSNAFYWSNHGGVPALVKEFAKCQSLCCWCHRLKSDRERGTQKQKSKINRQAIINAEKLRRGKCLRCPRLVTLETCCAFDFDHRDASTKVMKLSKFTHRSQTFFDQHIESELNACDLLCCSCHKKVTIARKKR